MKTWSRCRSSVVACPALHPPWRPPPGCSSWWGCPPCWRGPGTWPGCASPPGQWLKNRKINMRLRQRNESRTMHWKVKKTFLREWNKNKRKIEEEKGHGIRIAVYNIYSYKFICEKERKKKIILVFWRYSLRYRYWYRYRYISSNSHMETDQSERIFKNIASELWKYQVRTTTKYQRRTIKDYKKIK